MSQQIENGSELIKIQLIFEKKEEVDSYVLMYYDATLQEELNLPENSINNVNLINLEREMAAMDWRKAFELDEIKVLNLEDETSWQKEQKM